MEIKSRKRAPTLLDLRCYFASLRSSSSSSSFLRSYTYILGFVHVFERSPSSFGFFFGVPMAFVFLLPPIRLEVDDNLMRWAGSPLPFSCSRAHVSRVYPLLTILRISMFMYHEGSK